MVHHISNSKRQHAISHTLAQHPKTTTTTASTPPPPVCKAHRQQDLQHWPGETHVASNLMRDAAQQQQQQQGRVVVMPAQTHRLPLLCWCRQAPAQDLQAAFDALLLQALSQLLIPAGDALHTTGSQPPSPYSAAAAGATGVHAWVSFTCLSTQNAAAGVGAGSGAGGTVHNFSDPPLFSAPAGCCWWLLQPAVPRP